MWCLILVRPRRQGKAGVTSSAKMEFPHQQSGVSGIWVAVSWGGLVATRWDCMVNVEIYESSALILHAKVKTPELQKSLLRHLAPTPMASSCNHLVIGEHRTTQSSADTAGKPIPYTDQWFRAWPSLIYSLLPSFLLDPFYNKDYSTVWLS